MRGAEPFGRNDDVHARDVDRVDEIFITVVGESDALKPVEDLRQHLIGGEVGTITEIDRRSGVIPFIERGAAGAGGGVTDSLVDFGYVASVAEIDAVLAIALDVPDRRETRADAVIVGSGDAGLIDDVVLVIAHPEVEAPARVQVPAVVEEQRAGVGLSGLAEVGDRPPLNAVTCNGRIDAQKYVLALIKELAED